MPRLHGSAYNDNEQSEEFLNHTFIQRTAFQSASHTFRRTTAIIVAALVVAARTNAQFEGIIESKNVTTDQMGKPQKYVMTMWIKKDMVRIETSGLPDPGSTMIYRTDQKRIYMINPDEKSYFEISQEEKPQELYTQGGSGAKYSVRRTGKTKSIAGYPCEQFIIKREDESTELWGTKKLPHVVATLSKALGQDHVEAADGAVNEVMKMGIYPMFSATKVEGILIEQQEVTKVDARQLDLSIFSIPAGYTKQKSIEIMNGMQDLRK